MTRLELRLPKVERHHGLISPRRVRAAGSRRNGENRARRRCAPLASFSRACPPSSFDSTAGAFFSRRWRCLLAARSRRALPHQTQWGQPPSAPSDPPLITVLYYNIEYPAASRVACSNEYYTPACTGATMRISMATTHGRTARETNYNRMKHCIK